MTINELKQYICDAPDDMKVFIVKEESRDNFELREVRVVWESTNETIEKKRIELRY